MCFCPVKRTRCFHSISFPSEWGEKRSENVFLLPLGFHSISFPSEWGDRVSKQSAFCEERVSIQLVSPASGEVPSALSVYLDAVSIQLVSPASGEIDELTHFSESVILFPFN